MSGQTAGFGKRWPAWLLQSCWGLCSQSAPGEALAPLENGTWGRKFGRLRLMAIPEGLEPPTPCLEGTCSILLSYGTSLASPAPIWYSVGEPGCRMLRGKVEVKGEGK